MAKKVVSLIRSFGYVDGEGKDWYFTRTNEGEILGALGEDNLQPYIDNGIIAVYDEPDPAELDAAFGRNRTKGIRPSNAGTPAAAAPTPPRAAPRSTTKET